MAPTEKAKSNVRIYIPLLLIILTICLATWYWYRDYTMYISSDDAHIEADNVQIGAKILGRLAHLYAIEGDSVKKNTLLVELDSLDLLAQKRQTQSMLVQAEAQLEQVKAKLKYDT